MENLRVNGPIACTVLRANCARQLLTVLLLIVLPLAASAQFTFVTNNNSITITGYNGASNNVVIPSATNGYPVTSIGDRAFFNGQQGYGRLTSMTIPDSVTNIGYSAFYECYGLTNISLGNGVIAIGSNAFQACLKLSNIFLPATVISIGPQPFIGCTNLTAINMDAANPVYSSVAGVLFDHSQATLIQCPGGLTGTFAVPNTVGSIGNLAFANCPRLTGITISSNVTNIGIQAFENCTGLTNIAIPASVANIGIQAFVNCAHLAAITVDTNNPSFSSVNGVLFDQPGATLIQYPEAIAGGYTVPGGVTSIADEAFYNCSNLTSVTLPAGVANIGNSAFSACKKLTTANFPSSLTNIGGYAFYDCTGLALAITFGDNLRNLGDYAFELCGGVTSVTTGNGLTRIGNSVFYFCGGLTNVTLGSNVTSIGPYAFYDCANITSFIIPAGVTNIGDFAFSDCSKLSAITIPQGVTSIGNDVFQNCYALKSVIFPAGITNIGYNSFNYAGLTSVVIPASVTSIGGNAFCYCTSLKTVYFQGIAPTSLASSAFLYSGASTVYALPGTTGWTTFTSVTGLSVTPWLLPNPTILAFEPNFGVKTNNFGFTISWATNGSVVVEACTNLANAVWTSVATNTLTSGASYFSDAQWSNYSARYYRLRSP